MILLYIDWQFILAVLVVAAAIGWIVYRLSQKRDEESPHVVDVRSRRPAARNVRNLWNPDAARKEHRHRRILLNAAKRTKRTAEIGIKDYIL